MVAEMFQSVRRILQKISHPLNSTCQNIICWVLHVTDTARVAFADMLMGLGIVSLTDAGVCLKDHWWDRTSSNAPTNKFPATSPPPHCLVNPLMEAFFIFLASTWALHLVIDIYIYLQLHLLSYIYLYLHIRLQQLIINLNIFTTTST
jgi:hypothetical protein